MRRRLRIISADFKAKRAAERRLACLESKWATMLENIELMSRAFDAEVVIDSVDGSALHTHDGQPKDRQHTAIVCPTADDIYGLAKEIAATEHRIAEISARLDKVKSPSGGGNHARDHIRSDRGCCRRPHHSSSGKILRRSERIIRP